MISVSQVSKTYRRSGKSVQALADVTLEVPAGDFVVVCGSSGSGKTTLLLTAGGLLAPDSGQIILAGRDPYSLSQDDRAHLRAENVGFVFQQFYLVPYLTVRQNILCPALAAGGDDLAQRAGELIERFNLASRGDHLPSELSTGEKQRTALARAMLNRPKVMLADEPTGNLDDDNGRIVVETLRQFAEDGGAVLMVTHERQWAEYGRRIVRLEAGRVSRA
jgi:putative ABC transport system ATP-binding protein